MDLFEWVSNGDVLSFSGEYRWLSNFWPAKVVCRGLVFPTVENAYQAMKCKVFDQMVEFTHIKPWEAKKLGRTIVTREDWDIIKLETMRNLVHQKFWHEDLKQKLLATGHVMLIEGNTWGDTYWGVCNGKGENHLGKILMAERAELRALEMAA